MNHLIVLNEAPYGSERAYNALRLAATLAKREGQMVRLFLLADAVSCAKRGQSVPNGYYNVERMLKLLQDRGGEIAACGTCMEARGMADAELAPGIRRGTLEELTDWTVWADKVVTF